jgi:O-methyltransferase involved in polyketide biosynthesis
VGVSTWGPTLATANTALTATGTWSSDSDRRPSTAGITDRLLHGSSSFRADRHAADRLLTAWPQARRVALDTRAFCGRALRYAFADGIGQVLDVGCGLVTARSAYQVAREMTAAVRVGCVDIDPVVVLHARQQMAGDPDAVAVPGDVRDIEAVLGGREVRAVLHPGRPAVVLLSQVLAFVDDTAADTAMRRLRRLLAPGSFVVVAHHLVADEPDGTRTVSVLADAVAGVYAAAGATLTVRTRRGVEEFFDGLDLVRPGLTSVERWRPDGLARRQSAGNGVFMAGAVGRVPA